MELVKVGDKTYYIKNPTNIGIYKINENEVYIIDSGNDKDAGKKILKIINEQNWIVKGIIVTHSNADHIGGNKIIQDKTNCKIFANNIEKAFTENPILESAFLYGGYPFKDLRHKFLMAQPSKTCDIENDLPEGLEVINLKGHFFDMIGIKTSDDVYFLADSLFSEETIKKYHLFFIYDVNEFLNTLEKLKTLKGNFFIPSHCEPTKDIEYLINVNEEKIKEIMEYIYDLCTENTFEDILKLIFDHYDLKMNQEQYVLVGSTVRSYLSFLYDTGKIIYEFKNNKMIWKKVY